MKNRSAEIQKVIGIDRYNQSLTGNVSHTIRVAIGSDNIPCVLIETIELEKVTGVDLYNQTTTGGVTSTLRSRSSDAEHIPCVIIEVDDGIHICRKSNE